MSEFKLNQSYRILTLSLSLYYSTFRFTDISNISLGTSLLSSVYILYIILPHLTLYPAHNSLIATCLIRARSL